MPIIQIYLSDENYTKWIRLSKTKKKELRQDFKQNVIQEAGQ